MSPISTAFATNYGENISEGAESTGAGDARFGLQRISRGLRLKWNQQGPEMLSFSREEMAGNIFSHGIFPS